MAQIRGRLSKCTRCKAPIVWARTVAGENGPGGKAMPLDPEPNPAGNVAVRPQRRGELLARVLKADEDHDHHTEVRAMPHFATCKANPAVAGKQLANEVENFLREKAEGGEKR